MKIEIRNPEYDKLEKEECAEADRILAQMIDFEYFKEQIEHSAVNNANVVYPNIGILNISKRQARILQKMVDNRVKHILQEEAEQIVKAESLFMISEQ